MSQAHTLLVCVMRCSTPPKSLTFDLTAAISPVVVVASALGDPEEDTRLRLRIL
jgi:hypothetical protein